MTAEQGLALAEVARCGLRQPAAVTFRFVEDDLAEWPVAWMFDALEVSESGDHAWAGRVPAPAASRRGELVAAITAIDAEVRGRYGRPRMAAELTAGGHACAVNTVAERMRAAGTRAKAWSAENMYVPTAEG